MWRLLYLLQIADQPAPAVLIPTFVPPPCGRSSGDEIVVCKPKSDPARFGPRLKEAEPALPQAEFRLFGNVRARASGEQRGVGGFSAPAAMLTVRVPF